MYAIRCRWFEISIRVACSTSSAMLFGHRMQRHIADFASNQNCSMHRSTAMYVSIIATGGSRCMLCISRDRCSFDYQRHRCVHSPSTHSKHMFLGSPCGVHGSVLAFSPSGVFALTSLGALLGCLGESLWGPFGIPLGSLGEYLGPFGLRGEGGSLGGLLVDIPGGRGVSGGAFGGVGGLWGGRVKVSTSAARQLLKCYLVIN